MRKDIERDLGMKVPYKRAWQAAERAKQILNGSDKQSYLLLPNYCEQIPERNPNSIAFVEWIKETRRFRRLFISYEASAQGFASCRPLLGLDGTHLKSKYLGILLAATAVDTNGSLFPLASAVVDAENDENWLWFMHNLRTVIVDNAALHLHFPEKFVFLSDRQKGLIDGVEAVFLRSPHGYCLRHLGENMGKSFKKKELKTLLWKVALASTVSEFVSGMNEMRTMDEKCADWLLTTADKEHWAEAFFPGRRYDHLYTLR